MTPHTYVTTLEFVEQINQAFLKKDDIPACPARFASFPSAADPRPWLGGFATMVLPPLALPPLFLALARPFAPAAVPLALADIKSPHIAQFFAAGLLL